MARRLLITHRPVPPDRSEEYDRAWKEMQAAAANIPCHAWRYRSVSSPETYIEFLEFGGGADPRTDTAVSRAIRMLYAVARGTIEEWLDATNPEVRK